MDPIALESHQKKKKSLVDKYVIVPKNVFDYN